MSSFKVLMLGDITGDSGMGALFLGLSSLIKEKKADFVIVNGENASKGFGLSDENYYTLKKLGVTVITSGNHIWQDESIFPILEKEDDILRPLNYPSPCPGRGYTIKTYSKNTVGVINLQGRINMFPIDDPFKAADEAIKAISQKTNLIFVDFHAENTEEKEALAFYLDGRVTGIVGTHTHVQTMDEKILYKGTSYITDLGLTGVVDEVIGSKSEVALERAFTQLPIKSEVSDKKGKIQGVLIEADDKTGKTIKIERFTYL